MSPVPSVRRFILAAVGITLLSLTAGGFIAAETEGPDLSRWVLPALSGLVLLALNRRLRAEPDDVASVGTGAVAGGVVFAAVEVWTLVAVEVPTSGPAVVNVGAAGSLVGAGVAAAAARRTRRERDRLEAAVRTLRARNDRLRDEVDRLDEFAGTVSHDLRSHLSTANGYVSLARESGDEAHFDRAVNALERAEAVTSTMLDLAREGRPVDDTAAVDLEAVVQRAWSAVDTDDLTLDVTTRYVVEADESRLQQLFENLFKNTLEHGGPDVTMVRVGSHEPDGFFVEDDGAGVAPDTLERLFETEYSTGDDGSGYGLTIVESVVEAHGWTVSATESEDGGLRFEVEGVDVVDPG